MPGLRADEIWRMKFELGFNVLNVGAEPYIGVSRLFEQVIAAYIDATLETTSSTAVTAAGIQTLTVAANPGFVVGQPLVIDVGERSEKGFLQAISGLTITLLLNKLHSGTYSVIVEGPITIARELLAKIEAVKAQLGSTMGEGTLKKVDEIEFYQGGASQFGSVGDQLMFWRNELASCFGIVNLWARKQGYGGNMVVC